jgi:hypothetical protein
VTAEASGFAKSQVDLTLLTEQNLSVPITLKVGSISEAVNVSAEAPVVDTSDSRTQLTLENQTVAQLPVVGRNLVTLVTLAPGVSGLGTSATGSPGSGVDNFSTEEQVDASANGQGQNNNQYVVDGLDVTSGIRQGVLNLTQPNSIRFSIQVNTFVEYSRAASCKPFHPLRHRPVPRFCQTISIIGCARSNIGPYPFHSNMGFAIGGPQIPQSHLFFYPREPRFISKHEWIGDIADPRIKQLSRNYFPNMVGTSPSTTCPPRPGVSVPQTGNRFLVRRRCSVALPGGRCACAPPTSIRSFAPHTAGNKKFCRLDAP